MSEEQRMDMDDSSGDEHAEMGEDAVPMEVEANEGSKGPQTWDPSVYELQEGEELDYDSTAYRCMHEMGMEWPALSFDLIPDTLGFMRKTWPQTMYLMSGSQAQEPSQNRLVVMKVSNITEMKPDNPDEDDDDEEDEDYIPLVKSVLIRQKSAVNRIKCMPQNSAFNAVWSEDGNVSLHNVAPLLRSLDDEKNEEMVRVVDWKPVADFTGHAREGFALAWSPLAEGVLASGDGDGKIHLWEPETVGGRKNWVVDTVALQGHGGSVEDLVWSPSEARVLASCSTDRTVKLWDARGGKKPVAGLTGFADEVNVLAWNPHVTHLLASGGDDGVWKVHDLRKVGADGLGSEVFTFGFHKQPITSLEWSPFEDSMIAIASSDDSVTVWDLSATADEDEPTPDLSADPYLATVPEQLLFVHRGLWDPKEVHWHKQIPGMLVATASNGFHMFAPENLQ